MTDLRQAAQMALDALQNCANGEDDVLLTRDALATLRTALGQQQAEPAPEPVATVTVMTQGVRRNYSFQALQKLPDGVNNLYTDQPQRKPLTDEEIIGAMHEDGCERIENFYVVGPVQKAAVFSFARAIQAKLKQKKNT